MMSSHEACRPNTRIGLLSNTRSFGVFHRVPREPIGCATDANVRQLGQDSNLARLFSLLSSFHTLAMVRGARIDERTGGLDCGLRSHYGPYISRIRTDASSDLVARPRSCLADGPAQRTRNGEPRS